MFKKLNPLLHSELRLAVMSILVGVDEADFVYIRKQTGATAGNLSVQLDKLSEAGYITVEKGFKGKKPCTSWNLRILRICRRLEGLHHVVSSTFVRLRAYLLP